MYKNTSLLFVLSYLLFTNLLFASLQAQEHKDYRQKYSLDRGWLFHQGDIAFPAIKGHSASYNNAKAGKSWGAAAPKYDDSQWKEVDLPHDWAVEQPFNPTANLSVEFEINGPGKIIGLGNGNPNSHEAEKGNKRSLFNGYAQVIIQSAPKAIEPIALTAKINGLPSQTVQIQTIPSNGSLYVPIKRAPIILSQWYVSPHYTSRPAPNEKVEENDMNSWELITAGHLTNAPAAGFYLYRALLPPADTHKVKGGIIQFKKLKGKAEIWLGGKKLAAKETIQSGDLKVHFMPLQKTEEIRILFETSQDVPVGLGAAVTIDNLE